MFHRTLAALILALLASSGRPPGDSSSPPQPATAEVDLVSVSPGTAVGGDWCVDGVAAVVLTAHAIDVASGNELTDGTIEWQTCSAPGGGGLPKEDCEGHGGARWAGQVITDLSVDSTPSLTTRFVGPVLGWRLQFRPAQGGGFRRARSDSFNLDRTCSL